MSMMSRLDAAISETPAEPRGLDWPAPKTTRILAPMSSARYARLEVAACAHHPGAIITDNTARRIAMEWVSGTWRGLMLYEIARGHEFEPDAVLACALGEIRDEADRLAFAAWLTVASEALRQAA